MIKLDYTSIENSPHIYFYTAWNDARKIQTIAFNNSDLIKFTILLLTGYIWKIEYFGHDTKLAHPQLLIFLTFFIYFP